MRLAVLALSMFALVPVLISAGVTAAFAQKVTPVLALDVQPPLGLLGRQVTMTATFDPRTLNGHSIDGESVDFYDFSTKLGSGVITNNKAQYQTSSLGLRGHSLTAHYNGDVNLNPAVSDPVDYAVYRAVAKLTLTVVPPSPAGIGQAVTMTAVFDKDLLNGYTIPDGEEVRFCHAPMIQNECFGSGKIYNNHGQYEAQYQSPLPGGAYILYAHFDGDAVLNSADSNNVYYGVVSPTLSLSVQPPSPSKLGEFVRPYVVFSDLYGDDIDGEYADFYDGDTLLGSVQIRNSQARFSTSALAVGTHMLKAHYKGDLKIGQADSNVIPYTVLPPAK
jgi:hypothetical protein